MTDVDWDSIEPTWSGDMGRGWDVWPQHLAEVEDVGAGLVGCVIHIPWEEHSGKAAALGMKATISVPGFGDIDVTGAAVPWEWYVLLGISLAEFPGIGPPWKRFPAATHELLIMALNPDYPVGFSHWATLEPPNAVFQVVCAADDMFVRVSHTIARWLCVDPVAWIEGPETPKQRSHRFAHVFRQTLEQEVTGGHT